MNPSSAARAPTIASSSDSGMAVSCASAISETIPAGPWWASLLGLCLLLLAPLALVDVPPLLDYPNHLARLFVLAFAAGDPVIGRFYTTHWSVLPDLGIDLV